MKHFFHSITFLVLILIAGNASAQWQWVHPTPQGNDIKCISFPSLTTGYAGADKGVVLKSTNNGGGWSLLYTNKMAPVSALYFSDASFGYVAQQEYLMNTVNGGTNFNVKFRFNDLFLDKMQFLNADSGWVTGEFLGMWELRMTNDSANSFTTLYGSADKITTIELLQNGRGWLSTSAGNVERTDDYGQSWQLLGNFNSTGFNDIQFRDSLNGFACADNGQIFRTTDGGGNWTSLNNPASSSSIAFNALHFVSLSTGIVTGTDGFTLTTTDSGQTWSVNSMPGWFTGYAIAENALNNIFVAGTNGEILSSNNLGLSWTSATSAVAENSLNGITHTTAGYYACGDFGLLMGGNGSAWSMLNSPTSNSLYGIAFNTPGNGIAVGEAGTIVRTINAGAAWTTVASGVSTNLWSATTNSSHIYACGDGETLLRSINGGQTWTSLTTPLSGTGFIYVDVQFPSLDTGYVITDQNDILSTTDGGNNWTVLNIPSAGAITGVHFIDGLRGWMCSNFNEVYNTTDGGNSWNLQFQYNKPVTLNGIVFRNALNGFVYADGVMLRTIDGGNYWSEEFYPSSKKINGVDINGGILTSVGAGRASILQRFEDLTFAVADLNLCMENTYTGTLTYSGPFTNRNGEIQLSDEFGDFFNPYIIGTLTPGATTASFEIPAGIIDATGYRLRVVMYNPTLISNATDAKTIMTSPSVQIQASGPTVFCPGDSVILFVGGNPNWTYQWLRDSVVIPGATSDLLTVFTTGRYTIQVFDTQCGYHSQPVDVLVSCTGLNELQASFLKASPNPSSGIINVSWPQTRKVNKLYMTEITGRQIGVFEPTGNSLSLDMTGLNPGMYLLYPEGRKQDVIRLVRN